MRFGTLALQINRMTTPGAPAPRAAFELLTLDHARMARKVAEMGFEVLEISCDTGYWLPHLFKPGAIKKLAALKKELGIRYTVHLPFWSLEPAAPHKPVRHAAVDTIVDFLQRTEPLEPESWVLHATGAMASDFHLMDVDGRGRTLLLDRFRRAASKSVRSIIRRTGINPRRLAIENIDFPFDLTVEIAELHDTGFCFDVGHVLAGYCDNDRETHLTVAEVFERVRPRLAEIHLHDSKPGSLLQPARGGDHIPLGQGCLDIPAFLQMVESSGWDGPTVLELTDGDAALESLRVIEQVRSGEALALAAD